MLTGPATLDGFVASVDETARGTLVGDVCAAAVIMPRVFDTNDELVKLINDSKKLTPKRRKVLAEYIKQKAIAYGIGTASVQEIDEHNILQATYIAMHRALDIAYSKQPFTRVEVDGQNFKPYLPPGVDTTWMDHECVIDGDAQRLGIAAASILAKVYRDEWIVELCNKMPLLEDRYGLKSNKGYGTKKHMEGLATYGASEYHRKSFAPVARALGKH